MSLYRASASNVALNVQSMSAMVPPINEILNINQAGYYLRLSKSGIYKLTMNRLIPHFKMSKKIYFKRIELDEWISKHRIKTKEDKSSN